MLARIPTIKAVTCGILKIKPPIVYVAAIGTVPTSGWTDALLLPHIYITPPADGIQVFDFVAKPPSGIVLPCVSEISAVGEILQQGWMKGVRVCGVTNCEECLFGSAECVDPLDVGEQGFI